MHHEYINNALSIYNAGIAVIIVLLIGQVNHTYKKVDNNLLKANLFLDSSRIDNLWIQLSIAGMSFAIATISNLITLKYQINLTYLIFPAQTLFVITFTLSIHNWHTIIKRSKKLHKQ